MSKKISKKNSVEGGYPLLNNGFTLIELLAVIVILAIIALIATPIVLDIIEDSKTSSNKISISNYAKSIELSISNYMMNNNDILNNTTTIFSSWIEENVEVDNSKITCEKVDYDNEVILKECTIEGVNDTFCYKNGTTYLNDECTNSLLYKGTNVNLVTNGNLEYGDNTNFSTFTYEDGWLSPVFSIGTVRVTDEYIEIDTSKKYEISATMRANNNNTKLYAGISEYDIDKNHIQSQNYMYIENTLTYLTEDLKDGDTVVYLNDLSNWLHDESTSSFNLGFIFWNYKDSTGYEYPELTYSRNIWYGLFTYDNVDVENNTITLTNPWDKGTIESGTKLSQSQMGAALNYGLLGNTSLTLEEKEYSFNVTGEFYNTEGKNCSLNMFRPATKYIKVHFSNLANSDIITIFVKDIEVKEID